MKAKYRLLALILAMLLAISCGTAFAADDGYASTYTYNYDYWSDIRESPDVYRVSDIIYSGELGLDVTMKKPQSLFVQGNDLYVVDTGNNRILQISREGSSFKLARIIDSIQGCDVTTFNAPGDVFVDAQQNIYIADTNNGRVVMVDKDLNFIKEFVKPSNAVFSSAQKKEAAQSAVEVEDGVASIVLPIGNYTVKEKENSAAVDGYNLTLAGNNVTVCIRENMSAVVQVVNVYNAVDVAKGDKINAEKVDVAELTYVELSSDELALVAAAEAETGAPHGVLRVSSAAMGAEKPAGIGYDIAEVQGNNQSNYYSEFRNGVLSVAAPIGDYTITQDVATAKVPNFDTTVIGGVYDVWVKEDRAVTVNYINLYTNGANPLDVDAYTVPESTYVELTELEKAHIESMEKEHPGTEYGIIRISASSVNAEIPSNTVFDQSLSFLPSKLVVDVSGRLFLLATNVNKGLVKFESDTSFTGFIGANKVTYNFVEYVWKNYLMTKAQREQQASFVPTEYCNIYMDEESFIYATNVVFSEYDLLYDAAQPIRRLNGIGNDILIKNDRYPPIGDLYWVEQNNHYGPSKFYDITVMENDIYVAVDKTRGRIFGYDSQGIMLWAFGTTGSREGAFNGAISIEHMGRDLFVLDEVECSVTVFTPTEYGNMIYDASGAYLKGDYDGSAELWRDVLKYNANYNLAFIGIGRALMRQESYKEAMDYFKMAMDRDNYGRAFRFYRKVWVEENIGWLVLLVAAVLIIPVVRSKIRKMRMEVEVHERNQVQK